MRPAPIHYLRRNEAVTTPASVCYLDVAHTLTPTEGGEVARLRCWAGRLVVRRVSAGHPARELETTGRTAAELAGFLELASRGRDSTWCYMHDLGRDLVTSRLPAALSAAGWSVTDFALSDQAPWMRLRKGRRGLTLVDSWSLLPASTAQLATLTGIKARPEPDAGDPEPKWRDWCANQTLILAEAMEELLDWWDRAELGRWSITGPTTGWAAMRHTLNRKDILIDPAPAAQSADRAAIYTGRRGVWRVGDFDQGPYLEIDMVNAYPSVAAELPLPVRRLVRFDGDRPPPPWPYLGDESILAEVVLDTDTPRWPLRTRHGVLYPVGRFVTTLAGPDLAEARELGALVEVRGGWMHELGTVLVPWARWLLDVAEGRDGTAPGVARVTAKAWGRSVIGKFATRAWSSERLCDWDPQVWRYADGVDGATGNPAGMVFLGGSVYWTRQGEVGPDAYPAVNAWVESHVRTRLGRLVDAVGEGALLLANTDGLVVDGAVLGTPAAEGAVVAPAGLTREATWQYTLDALNALAAPLRLRIKQICSAVTILGPQTYQLDRERRFSGIPKSAKADKNGRLSYRTWPSLTWQLAHGNQEGYVTERVTSLAGDPHPTGWLTATGHVLPPVARVGDAGRSELVPWRQTPYPAAGHRLADVQHPELRKLA